MVMIVDRQSHRKQSLQHSIVLRTGRILQAAQSKTQIVELHFYAPGGRGCEQLYDAHQILLRTTQLLKSPDYLPMEEHERRAVDFQVDLSEYPSPEQIVQFLELLLDILQQTQCRREVSLTVRLPLLVA